MAYNADNEIREELVNIQKNNRGDYIIASKITNKNNGNVSVDIRNFYTNDEDEVRPTSKGVRINSEMLPELLGGLIKALEADEVEDLNDKLESLLDDGSDSEDSADSE